MTDREQDELRVLRERAYGPAADIHLDSTALQRLHDLEGRGARPEATQVTDDVQPIELFPPPAEEPPVPADEAVVPLVEPRRPPFRVRRSTVLIVLALVALIVVSYAAFEIVERVQADPLQAGAPQVARLSEDVTFETPDYLSSWFAQPEEAQAYEEFHGLRAIVNDNGSATPDKCILVYPSESATDSDGNFMGPAYSGCAAGAFPAAVAFRVDATFPQQLRSLFPDGTALQFVFDEGGNEVVVFADEGEVEAAAGPAGPVYREIESIPPMSSRTDSFPA